ncbi:Stk1 family PASTA domain-containing Ser/Thr kinase [Streptomyces capparidis]
MTAQDPSPSFGGGGDPLVGRTLDGRYRVEGRIAGGGMATVYRAVDTRLDRVLALKVMHPQLAAEPGFVERFIREAKAVARLSHPNVVGVHDQGTDGEWVFLAMEYVSGCTLRDVLRGRGALHPRAALDILEPVLAALGAAHRSGLVHRDVKPENVLIGDDGRVKVADFGLVRAVGTITSTSAETVIGSVPYLSPEQIQQRTVDARTDVYACGVLLYEMLTGSRPHDGEHAMQVMYKHVNEDVPAPSAKVPGLAAELDGLVARSTAREPGRRPKDAAEMLLLLRATRRALTDEELDVEPPATAVATAVVGAGEEAARTTRLRRPAGDALNRTSRLQLPPEPAGPGTPPADPPAGPPPVSWLRRPWLRPGRAALTITAVVAVVAGVAALVWFVGLGRYTTTPSLLGKSKATAEHQLEQDGLKARITEVFSESIPVDKVVSTDPAQGERIREGGTVTVAVSKGPERLAVPAVKGEKRKDAERLIEEARLTVGTAKLAFSEEVDEGRVIRTDPAAGSRVKPDAPVSLVISKGRPVDVPDLVGLTLDEAQDELSAAGLEMRTSSRKVFSDEVDEGSVVLQSPGEGRRLAKGAQVTVTLSKGPQLFEVPDVKGKKEGEAREILEEAGFEVDVFDALPVFGDNKVWRQSPGGGSQKPKGTTIDLTVR